MVDIVSFLCSSDSEFLSWSQFYCRILKFTKEQRNLFVRGHLLKLLVIWIFCAHNKKKVWEHLVVLVKKIKSSFKLNYYCIFPSRILNLNLKTLKNLLITGLFDQNSPGNVMKLSLFSHKSSYKYLPDIL